MAKAPVFQHRHYKAIAALISTMGCDKDIVAYVGEEFADLFASDNERFDRARFLAAANGKPSNGRDKV